MHLNKGMEFRGGYYCHRPPHSNQQKKEGVVEWTVRWGAPFSPLQSHGTV